MADPNTDRDWESLAQDEPYWSVLSSEEFCRKNLTPEALARFFSSGAEQVNSIAQMLRWRFSAPEHFNLTLDFGCGVGRLLLSLAQISDKALGIDVSPTMLGLCRKQAAARNITNIELHQSDDDFSSVQQYARCVDLITSFIVLQHIPPRRGARLLTELLKMLRPGGFGFIHITFAAMIESLHYEAANVTGSAYRFYQRTSDGLMKLVEEPRADLQIQMNHYNLNEVMCIFYQAGVSDIFTRFTNHANIIGAEFYFQRT